MLANAWRMNLRKTAHQVLGGHGILGHFKDDSALHFPSILLPGILSPRLLAKSAIVITLKYIRQKFICNRSPGVVLHFVRIAFMMD